LLPGLPRSLEKVGVFEYDTPMKYSQAITKVFEGEWGNLLDTLLEKSNEE
jgi:hypothetical protein